LPHQLIEEVHGLCAVRLQRLDHLLAREQRLDLVLQLVDFAISLSSLATSLFRNLLRSAWISIFVA